MTVAELVAELSIFDDNLEVTCIPDSGPGGVREPVGVIKEGTRVVITLSEELA